MKKSIKLNLILLLAITSMLPACQKNERDLNSNLNSVAKLNLPADMANINLQPTTTATETFKWDNADVEDGGLVLYEVVFDKETGNFSSPVYKILSDGGGVQNQATITHKVLVKIAAAGGINTSTTGKLKWAVVASKALNKKTSSDAKTIQLQRPAGFADIPTTLYITGTATEGGADVNTALPMKKIDEGVFEIYTSLKLGDYQLTDKQNSTGRKFYIDGPVIKEGATSTTVTGGTKVYRLKYDFNVASVLDATEIQNVGLFMSAYNTEIGQLAYIGGGKWQAASIPVVFYQFSWGRDERYKFIFHTPAGNEYVGSFNPNNVSPVGQPASYFYLYPVNNAQWDYTYKFNPSADNKNVKVTLNYGPTGPYTHEVITL
jgi:starch-binding outer membrane protein SusE/F